tara:strand:- start:132 stop:1391 length:1260 start_codon:yes stop_codon:yes gene_type:complete
MKIIYFIIFIFYSCIDIIAPLNENHSLYFKGGGWVEIPQKSGDNDISVINNRFTLQFWVAGDSINTEESPALFSIVDSVENIIFGFFRDPNNNNSIDIYINNELKTIDTLINQFDVLDWSRPDQFYLISIISNQLNNVYDYGEEFIDQVNGLWDIGEVYYDWGLDQCPDSLETGLNNSSQCLDSLSFFYYCGNDSIQDVNEAINNDICQEYIETDLDSTLWDPNNDNWNDCGVDNLCIGDFGYIEPDDNEGNGFWDSGEKIDQNGNYDLGELFNDKGNDVWEMGEVFFDTSGIEIYLNDSKIFHFNEELNIGDANLILGAIANKEYTLLENFWYGRFDEVRLWNTLIPDTTIEFHYNNPNKISDYYQHNYLDSLIGIWRFNIEYNSVSEILFDESGNGNDGIIYTIKDSSVEISSLHAE